MAEDRSPSPTLLSDYEAIERAVTETERGRWFLNEFSRRNRLAETRTLLDAIARLERALADDGAGLDVERRPDPEAGDAAAARIRAGLAGLADLIAQTKERVSLPPFDSLEAPALDPLAVVARTTRRVASTLAATAGHVRDAAAALREHGVEPDLCRAVERQAVEVSTTATIQALAAQRVAVVVEALVRLDAEVNALQALCGETRPARSARDGDRTGRCAAPDPDAARDPLRGAPDLVT